MEQLDDPTRFVLVEVYRQPEDAAKRKQTEHYAVWRDAVAPMMAEPRSGIKYSNIAPADSDW
jgi:quinol monooxygenase YgiN